MNNTNRNTPVPMNCIIFDTETTGLDPAEHHIIEIGAVRFRDGRPTKEHFYTLVNPRRKIDPEAVAVHGITDDMVRESAPFVDVIDGFLDFVGDLPLVAHNAGFDAKFMEREMERVGKTPFPKDRYVDTLEIARRRFPGAAATLDALCKKMKISLARRVKHSALIDSELLAEVCVELNGGRQLSMIDSLDVDTGAAVGTTAGMIIDRPSRVLYATPQERAAHNAFIAELGENALWNKISKTALEAV